MTEEEVLAAEDPNAPAAFSIVERVRFGDLDAMQHLNNVEFLRYFESARIAYLQQLLPEHDPTVRDRFGWILAECHIRYRSPGFFDEMLRIFIRPGELKRSSFELLFEIRGEDDDRLVAEGSGTMVGYDYSAATAEAIPDDIRERLGSDTA
ncbi:MAG: acyl-CoA thioesterase [Thermoleophilaceae bacterium]